MAASFGLYRITFQDICMVRMPLSDKMVSDALDEHDDYAENFLCGKFRVRVLACNVDIQEGVIDVHKDLVFHRLRNANYGDHFREQAQQLHTK